MSDDNPKPFYIKSVSKQNIPKKKVTNDFDDSDASIDKTFDSINKNFTHSIDNNILGDSWTQFYFCSNLNFLNINLYF